ncbi:MAG TPA: hypothetical protein VF773_00360 [Verrucomicrobiae bacterium]
MISAGADLGELIAVWAVQCSAREIIVENAYSEVNPKIHRCSPWRTVGAAATLEMNEIYGKRMSARPKHLQRAMEAEWLKSLGGVTAGALNSGANDTGK